MAVQNTAYDSGLASRLPRGVARSAVGRASHLSPYVYKIHVYATIYSQFVGNAIVYASEWLEHSIKWTLLI